MDDLLDRAFLSLDLSRLSGLKFSQIKNCEIRGKNGKRIGKLIDAVFRKTDDGLIITKFMIGGSFFEELLEDLRIIKNVDPVFPVTLITSISPKMIQLKVDKSDLKSTEIHTDAIETNEVKLSSLSRMKLFDKDEEDIGNIIDIKFYQSHFNFIVGDGIFREFMESIGLVADVDFLLNPKWISEMNNNEIRLNRDRAELKTTFDRHLPEYKSMVKNSEFEKDSGIFIG